MYSFFKKYQQFAESYECTNSSMSCFLFSAMATIGSSIWLIYDSHQANPDKLIDIIAFFIAIAGISGTFVTGCILEQHDARHVLERRIEEGRLTPEEQQQWEQLKKIMEYQEQCETTPLLLK